MRKGVSEQVSYHKMAEFEAATESGPADENFGDMFDLSKKKKKKTKKKTEDAELVADGDAAATDTAVSDSAATTSASGIVDTPNYTYGQLLQRVFDILHHHNPDLSDKRRWKIIPPQLMRVPNSTKKTLWTNFHDICKMMRRNPDHVFSFMMAELGTEGSIDGKQNLVIKGKFVPKYIESLLRKYILEYVQCQVCRSFITNLTRDAASRLYFVFCQDCNSQRSVSQIRAGYHAQTRADRRALRNT